MVRRISLFEGSRKGYSTTSQRSFAEELAKNVRVTSVQNLLLRVGVKLEEFDGDEKTENLSFRKLVAGLSWLVISTRPDISNAVRSLASYCSAPKVIHRKTALGFLAYMNDTFGFGITDQRGTLLAGVSLIFFADADRRPSGLLGNLHTCSAEVVVSSILTKVGFVFFLP